MWPAHLRETTPQKFILRKIEGKKTEVITTKHAIPRHQSSRQSLFLQGIAVAKRLTPDC
jgi:hypothetical protein